MHARAVDGFSWVVCTVSTVGEPPTVNTESPDVAVTPEALGELLGGYWISWHDRTAKHQPELRVRLDKIDGRWTVTGVFLFGRQITSADLRKVPLGLIENAVNTSLAADGEAIEEAAGLPPLVREPSMSSRDWSELVARHYKAWAKLHPNPAAAIAANLGANRQTVNAWVREARLRGLLPPARRGRASDPAEIARQREYDAVMAMRPGPERVTALADLEERHERQRREEAEGTD